MKNKRLNARVIVSPKCGNVSLYLSLGGHVTTIATPHRINPADYDFKKKTLRKSSEAYKPNCELFEHLETLAVGVFNGLRQYTDAIPMRQLRSIILRALQVETGGSEIIPIASRYIEERAKQITPGGIKILKTAMNGLANFLRENPQFNNINCVDDDFKNSFVAYMNAKNYKATTVKNRLALVFSFFRSVMPGQCLDKLPSVALPNGYNKQIFHGTTLDKNEINQLINAVPNLDTDAQRYAARFWLFSYSTGQRYSDVSSLKKDCFINDGGNHFINIVQQKTGESVTIQIDATAYGFAEAMDFNFTRFTAVTKTSNLRKAVRAAGIDSETAVNTNIAGRVKTEIKKKYEVLTLHDSRRSFVTNLRNNNISDCKIMQITGHKSLKTLQTYYKPTAEVMQEIANNLF